VKRVFVSFCANQNLVIDAKLVFYFSRGRQVPLLPMPHGVMNRPFLRGRPCKCSKWRPFAFTRARSRVYHWSVTSARYVSLSDILCPGLLQK